MVEGGMEQYAFQGNGSLSGFNTYISKSVREMAKSVKSRRAKIWVLVSLVWKGDITAHPHYG